MVGGRGNVSLPFCVDWHHFGAIFGTCVPVHQNHGHTMLSDGNIFIQMEIFAEENLLTFDDLCPKII